MSLVVLSGADACSCHIMIHMFQKCYTRLIVIKPNTEPTVNDEGYVYHSVKLDIVEYEFEDSSKIISYGILLPNLWNEHDQMQYAIVDKEWRFIDSALC